MPSYKIETNKIRNEYKWRNTYFATAPDFETLATAITLLVAMERSIHLPTVQLTTFSVKIVGSPEIPPYSIPVNLYGERGPEVQALPPFNVVRIDLQTPTYMGRKEYRYSAMENDINGWSLNPDYIDEIETAFNTMLGATDPTVVWQTQGLEALLVAQTYPYIQPRQLHRKRKPVEPTT